ncbi:MAG: penicillin-binding protein activator [Pseudomonadota bacterium]
MFAVFGFARKLRLVSTGVIAALTLAACEPITVAGLGGPTVNTSAAVPVALLVPQGGSTAGVSRSLENAARLAASDLQGAQIELTVYNTGGTSSGAAAAAQQAVADGNKIILGPLFGDSAAAAGSAVSSRGINVLSFSNNTAIAGGNVFILGNTFQNTANRLSSYAASQGRRDVAIIHAESPSEIIGRDAIARSLGQNGMRLAASLSFPLSQNGVVAAMPGIADRVRTSGATAVFLTSGNDGAIPFLASLLPENGIDPSNIQLIGLQRLDIPSTALSLPGLQGAWLATPDPNLQAQFNSRYFATYGSNPHPLAGLAYDGVAAIGALVSAGDSNALTGGALTRSSGFAGVNGVFRFNRNGTNSRGLAVAQIRSGQVVIIDPAPRSFGGPGF